MHAWASTPQSMAVDPTWPDPGRAYLGIPFADPSAWPRRHFGTGILQDPGNMLAVLRDGLASRAMPDVGRRTGS